MPQGLKIPSLKLTVHTWTYFSFWPLLFQVLQASLRESLAMSDNFSKDVYCNQLWNHKCLCCSKRRMVQLHGPCLKCGFWLFCKQFSIWQKHLPIDFEDSGLNNRFPNGSQPHHGTLSASQGVHLIQTSFSLDLEKPCRGQVLLEPSKSRPNVQGPRQRQKTAHTTRLVYQLFGFYTVWEISLKTQRHGGSNRAIFLWIFRVNKTRPSEKKKSGWGCIYIQRLGLLTKRW